MYFTIFVSNLVALDDVRKKVSNERRKETWARVSTAPTHRATTAPDLERLRANRGRFNPIVTSGAYSITPNSAYMDFGYMVFPDIWTIFFLDFSYIRLANEC